MTATLREYMRHAQLFGTLCVYEAAVEEGLSRGGLVRLRAECDALEAGRKSRYGFSAGSRPRRSPKEKLDAAVMLRAEGLTGAEIGEKLGVSAKHVERLLRKNRAGMTSTLTPPVRAPKTPANGGVKKGGHGPPETVPEAA